MKIVCDNCSTKYSIADEKVRGKVFKIKCKKCSHIIVVKGQEATGEGQPAGFDQKETRVFDYSGFEGQKDGGASGGGADPIWHLVIDREQVGPLTVAEVQQKWATGEADRDTYAWREGFNDWQRLGAIEELADVLHAAGGDQPAAGGEDTHAGATAEGGAGLFGDGGGTPAQGTPTVGRADPTDLFAGAGTSTEDEVPADLFGGARSSQPSVFSSSAAPQAAARGRQQEDLFGGGGSELGLAGEPASKPESRPTMTAQRNENSVLFSLNNLSALASSEPAAPAAAPAPSSSSGARTPSAFGSGSAEGSGLIDIRAMAAMTLGAAKKEDDHDRPRTRRASEDDLPVFSASSFSAPAAGVLLPSVQPQNNRMFYIAIAAVGVLALTAIILVAVILLGNKSTPAAASVVPSAPLRSDPVAPPVVPPEATAPTPPPGTTPPGTTPPATTPSKPVAATTPPTSPSERPKPTTPPTTARPPRTEPKPPTETARPSEPPRPPPETPKPPADQPSVKPQKCDEVACIVSPDLPCCPKKPGAAKPAPTADSGLPDRLDQADIIAGMKAVNGRVMACNDRFRVPGAFKVKVTVGADGSVTAASASAPVAGSAAAGCVEGAVKSARFKKTKNSITFNYPYTFR